ncbi:hypothetical protein [Arthrobacter sp. 4R501]|uniref:hypothetical protein n=1 Tax=Arthrobacter sp. 4R501 TaxID=2058886 RepID=UPI0011B0E42E|nr:hypothetical protein [Arthrobacter sp. 4R501]
MKNLKVFACLTAVLFTGMTVASCGSSTGAPNPGQTSPTPSSACAQFVSGAPCEKYTSTAGSDDGAPISWVTAGEVTAQLSKRGSDTYLTVVMPCGPLDAVVTINGKIMRITGQTALGASGCIENLGERQGWVLKLLEGSVELGYSNNTLTWTNGKDSLSFVTG